MERHRPLTTLADIAKRFFSPNEVAVLLGLGEEQRREAASQKAVPILSDDERWKADEQARAIYHARKELKKLK